jgi:hypothetical protein
MTTCQFFFREHSHGVITLHYFRPLESRIIQIA